MKRLPVSGSMWSGIIYSSSNFLVLGTSALILIDFVVYIELISKINVF